ncbi:MAG: hypothetical protein ACM4D3_07420 [Candidatus Sericytochromatia bacterium]
MSSFDPDGTELARVIRYSISPALISVAPAPIELVVFCEEQKQTNDGDSGWQCHADQFEAASVVLVEPDGKPDRCPRPKKERYP